MRTRSLFNYLDGNSQNARGFVGEDDVYRVLTLHSSLNKLHSKIIYNLNLENPKVQIDLIYINKDGVFVIEVKNWTGSINGSQEDTYWFRKHFVNHRLRVDRYLNPVRQNEYHINHLKRYIPINVPIYSLVVFASNNASHLKIDNVLSITKLSRYLLNLKSEVTLKDDDIDYIYNNLNEIKQKVVKWLP